MTKQQIKSDPSVSIESVDTLYIDYNQEDHTQRYDPKQFEDHAKKIIARVGATGFYSSAKRIKSAKKGLDLKGREESLSRMLAQMHAVFDIDIDDFNDRENPDDKKNWTTIPPTDDDYDYGEDAGVGFKSTSEEIYKELYSRGRGNPGKSRTGDLLIKPAHCAFVFARNWRCREGLGKFHPTFNYITPKNEAYEETDFGPSSRFFLAILQVINPLYTVEHASSIYRFFKAKKNNLISPK